MMHSFAVCNALGDSPDEAKGCFFDAGLSFSLQQSLAAAAVGSEAQVQVTYGCTFPPNTGSSAALRTDLLAVTGVLAVTVALVLAAVSGRVPLLGRPGMLPRFGTIAFFAAICAFVVQNAGGFSVQHAGQAGATVPSLNWHPVLMALSLLLLVEGAVSHRVWPKSGTLRHSVLMGTGVLAALGGAAVAVAHIGGRAAAGEQSSHFASMHSWFGLVAMTLLIFQPLVAVFSFMFTTNEGFRHEMRPYHRFFGHLTFGTMLYALLTGLKGYVPRFAADVCPSDTA